MKKSILIAAAVMLAGISHGQMFAQMFGGSAWTPASLNPVAWYRLDGNALDSSTYANHGTLVNSPTNAVDRNGTQGGALGFGGTRRIKIPDAAQTDLRQDLTVACWANPQSTGGGWVWSRTTDSVATTQYGVLCGANADGLAFSLNGASRVTTTINIDTWIHVVCVRSSGTVTMYTNAIVAKTATYTNALTAAPNINIGMRSASADNSTSAGPFVGYADDVLIFNRALTQAEITQLYNWRP
jgi:hypothetical protein